MAAHRLTAHTIDTESALSELLGEASELVRKKISAHLNPLTRFWIERSPFVCLATADEAGNCDVSPRGDPAGFVRILDDETLLLPERPGNKLADSLRNILRNPHVALIFIIPGVSDTFRVNGRATLTTDAALLEPCAVEGKLPKLGILIDIDSAYTHCSKAFLRSELWNPERFVERSSLPSAGEIHRAIQGADFDAEKYDTERAARYARREGFY
ncbi:MAG TPA: pyridoxamine 5'-phosphate oxidase family protein [Polyangiales bacterium]|nr:pyridoxamine 5'-phosphate oxidase family protein [Polyangiales bacterium]